MLDAFDLLFTESHSTEQATKETLGAVDLTSIQTFEDSPVVRFHKMSMQTHMFLNIAVARVLQDAEKVEVHGAKTDRGPITPRAAPEPLVRGRRAGEDRAPSRTRLGGYEKRSEDLK